MIKDLEFKKEVVIPMMIEGLDEKLAGNNEPYVSFTGKDKTGSLDCKLWGYNLQKLGNLKNGDIIKAQGIMDEYNGKKQFKISKSNKGRYLLRLANAEDNLDINEFIKVSPTPYEKMIDDINQMINKFSNEGFKKICLKFLEEYKEELKYFPGAKGVHHAYKTGWLYHIYNMMKMGNTVAETYDLNKDLLLTGVLLHDIGKIPAMISDMNGIVSEFSLEGAMLDHIVLSMKMFNELKEGLDIDKESLILIEHMIASHHGNLEWGSPVTPMFPEAEALHFLDNMDAKINTMKEILEPLDKGQSTDRIYQLGGRRLYKHSL